MAYLGQCAEEDESTTDGMRQPTEAVQSQDNEHVEGDEAAQKEQSNKKREKARLIGQRQTTEGGSGPR